MKKKLLCACCLLFMFSIPAIAAESADNNLRQLYSGAKAAIPDGWAVPDDEEQFAFIKEWSKEPIAAYILAPYVNGQRDFLIFKEKGQVKAIMLVMHFQRFDEDIKADKACFTNPVCFNNYVNRLGEFFGKLVEVKRLNFHITPATPSATLQGLFYSEAQISLFNSHELFMKEYVSVYEHQLLRVYLWCAGEEQERFETVFDDFIKSVQVPAPILLDAPIQPLDHDVTIELCGNKFVTMPAGWTTRALDYYLSWQSKGKGGCYRMGKPGWYILDWLDYKLDETTEMHVIIHESSLEEPLKNYQNYIYAQSEPEEFLQKLIADYIDKAALDENGQPLITSGYDVKENVLLWVAYTWQSSNSSLRILYLHAEYYTPYTRFLLLGQCPDKYREQIMPDYLKIINSFSAPFNGQATE